MAEKKDKKWIQKAWSAGIIDGEGCIHIGVRCGKNRKGYRLRVSVGNTDPRMITELQSIWGGTVNVNTKDKRPNRKTSWNWVMTDSPAAKMLEEMLPYLVCKKRSGIISY